jgi:hypothetical protein
MLCRTAAVAALAFFTDGWRPAALDHVDHDSLPVRCHWADAADAELCGLVLDAVELSWERQVHGLGFHAPIADDDGIFDVYITTEGTDGGAYVYGPSTDDDPSDGRMGCHSYMALDPAIGEADMASYVAHEFNHTSQYATDFVEPTLPIWEATATAAEAWTLDDYQIYSDWVGDFQKWPWMGILGDGYMLWDDHGVWSYHEYGAGMWILHMDAVHGDGAGSIGPALWEAVVQEGWTNEPDVLDGWATVSGVSWEEALVEFTAFRHVAGTALAPDWMWEQGDENWELVVDGRDVLDASELDEAVGLLPEYPVYPTGSWHSRVTGVTAEAPLHLRAQGAEGVRWALVITDEEGNIEDGDPTGHTSALTGTLTIGLVHLGEDGFDADHRLTGTIPSLTLSVGAPDDEPEPEDTGEEDIIDEVEEPAEEPSGSGDAGSGDDKGSGCSALGLGVSLGWIGGLGILARRRRS